MRGGPDLPDDEACRAVALATGREVNVYRGMTLAASSRPELYATGLLSPRMPWEAWKALSFDGRDRVITREQIREFQYLVGYRALRDPSGALLAVVATPTLFATPQAEIDAIRTSATIVIGIVLMLLIVLPLSITIARQISRPLAALTRATRRIADGDLERSVTVRGPRDVEELTESFNSMTAQLRRSRAELAAAERDSAWKEMARQVAHEIRNPLTPMKLAAQHLRRAANDDAPGMRALIERITGTIIDQIDTLARISDEFSRFGRMPKREPAPVNPADVLADAAVLFRHHPSITISVDAAANLPPILADRDELTRALTNILRNSVQAMPGGGDIRITAVPADRMLRVTITDTGCGIDPAQLPRIFEPNFSTKTEGMGLGLAIVRRILDDMGGRITIESSPGTGTTATLDLPFADAANTSRLRTL